MHESKMHFMGNEAPPNADQHIQAASEEHGNSTCCQCIARISWSAGLKARTASMEVKAVGGVVLGKPPL